MGSTETEAIVYQVAPLARLRRLTTSTVARLGVLESLIVALVAVGSFLRLVQYAYNRSLWFDEAMLALNVLQRSFGQLFQPLDYHQAAPSGFLLATKIVTLIMGTGEFALRLVPLLCGIAALPLLYLAARRSVGTAAVPVAIALLALSPHLIRYSAEFKQYSVDLCVTLILLLAAFRMRDDGGSRSSAAQLAVLGGCGLWFSHPSVFVLGGIGGALGLRFLHGKDWLSLRRLVLVGATWLGSFAVEYLVVIRKIDRSNFQAFWQASFLPLPPHDLAELVDWGRRSADVLHNPVGLELVYAAGVLLLIGSVEMIRRRWDLFLMLILPIAFTLLAAGLESYPFAGRLILFIVPLLALLIAQGAGSLWERTQGRGPRLLVLMVVGIILWGPATEALSVPFTREELRPVVAYLEDRYQTGDKVYVYYGAEPAFRYYTRDGGLSRAEVYYGVSSRGQPERYRADLDRMRGNDRVWVVFSHVHGRDPESEEQLFLEHLDTMGVSRRAFRQQGAAVFLYDLSEDPAGLVLSLTQDQPGQSQLVPKIGLRGPAMSPILEWTGLRGRMDLSPGGGEWGRFGVRQTGVGCSARHSSVNRLSG